MKRIVLGLFLSSLALAGCAAPQAPSAPSPSEDAQPDRGLADPEATVLAARVLETLGGAESWERVRYVSWRFFGGRHHLWDKHTGDVRIEADEWTLVMNLHTRRGAVRVDGEPVTDPAELEGWMERGWQTWVNDSYWMFMPYKLRDPGVTLVHAGTGEMLDGRPSELLELTFARVGVTPENRYVVHVSPETWLVEQWDFYAARDDSEPGFRMPWTDWTAHVGSWGVVRLAGSRGRGADWEIAVLEDVADDAFEL